jgi:NAD(P)-dependent dehydrogenase (short-subunit alcohol dehydrogenase family)
LAGVIEGVCRGLRPPRSGPRPGRRDAGAASPDRCPGQQCRAVAGTRRAVTADGHELTFQVNHLAPFLLTMLLKDRLAAAQGRVITTSSSAGTARGAAVVVDDLDLAGR